MRPGRQLDVAIAENVFHRNVFVKKKVLHETTEHGDRPLRGYSREIGAAWEVVQAMGIGLLPVENGQWFAIVGEGPDGWATPADFIKFLQSGNFVNAGAALAETAPLAICIAAIRAVESRKAGKDSSLAEGSLDQMLSDARSQTAQ